MSMKWIQERPPRWDAGKASIVAGVPAGVFELPDYAEGDLLPGDWWRVESDGKTVGYGWMDCIWGDAEVLLAVDPASRQRGVGTFILKHLEQEAATRGLNYLYNVVRPTHPDRDGISRWLEARRFQPSRDGLLKRQVPRGAARAD